MPPGFRLSQLGEQLGQAGAQGFTGELGDWLDPAGRDFVCCCVPALIVPYRDGARRGLA